MPRSRAEAAAVATSQELLRSALHRSQRRNTWVARRRLAWRWLVFLASRGLLYVGPPLALAGAAAWWWHQQAPAGPSASSTLPPVAPAPAPLSSTPARPAEPASSPLQLRLDDEVRQADPRPRHPRLPLRPPEAASTAAAQESM